MVFDHFFFGIVVFMPEKAKIISMVLTNHKGVEHLFDVRHERDGVAAKAQENTYETVRQVWAREK
jgi:hypothetical protein